ncbi:MAG: flagellar M-ring protein FliF [Lachnospiraceae bacterium]|nr:flagellar M-ring protein FliF [Lachnospiraceae bacterium]
MQNLKESWQKVPEKTRKIILGIVAGTAVIALIAILALTFGRKTDYSVLFSGLSQEEAQQIGALLQDQEIDYKYNASDGTIRVPEPVVESTRVTLLSQGYPKNGFAYDMYLDNTGLMTTESDKKQITLYELQDRLGATIRSFEGVQEARVNIAEASERRYVLEDNEAQGATASVVITMQEGSTLTEDKAQAVKNLISHSVRGMNFTEVVVLDGRTMMEVGGTGGENSSATDLTSLTTMVENSIAANVRNVLEKLYGQGSVAVSVKGTINMEKLIQESTQYSTPEKIDEQDKTGLLETEELVNESSQAYNREAGGVVGADANADTPRYTNEDETEEETENYYDGSASRQWLYNVIKEQRQIDPGILEDTSIGVIILTDNTSVPQADLYRLVANSAGIPVAEANDKITIIRDPGTQTGAEDVVNPPESTMGVITTLIPLPILIAIIAAILLLLLLLLFLLLRRRRKKKESEPQDEDFEGGDQLSASDLGIGDEADSGHAAVMGLDDEDEMNSEEIMNLRMQKSMRLKQNIAEFVDQNPQIAAKLVQSWLRGEEETDGRGRNAGHRKQSK